MEKMKDKEKKDEVKQDEVKQDEQQKDEEKSGKGNGDQKKPLDHGGVPPSQAILEGE
jgi:hypothetical protein